MKQTQETQGPFRDSLGYNVFKQKYAQGSDDTWARLAARVVEDVCGGLLSGSECSTLQRLIEEMKFIPGGRYLYYAGRPIKAFNNCYLLRAEEDTREEWSNLKHRASSCLMTGGGIGIDYSILRGAGGKLSRTGGVASGPLPLMFSINEIGRNIMQGGARRSAIYASLNWKHSDIDRFLTVKNWFDQPISGAFDKDGKPFTIWDAKLNNFNYPAPLDMTNISLNYDDLWLNSANRDADSTFRLNVEQALRTGEPGFSFNFGKKQNETLRNACTEVTSEDDSDVCNLGSINMSRIETLEEFKDAVHLASAFLVCGTLRADLPYRKVYDVREKNRRLGLGLMGIHEWLIRRGMRYEVTPELHEWLAIYKFESEYSANRLCDSLSISRPVAYRAIAPTGTIGILAGTTTGIEPIYAVAYKRRYLKNGDQWHYENCVDSTYRTIIESLNKEGRELEGVYETKRYNQDGEGRGSRLGRSNDGIHYGNVYNHSSRVDDSSEHNINMGNRDSGQPRIGNDNSGRTIDTALSLSRSWDGIARRLGVQADVQDYVDQAISSTLNCQGWGQGIAGDSDYVQRFSGILSGYAPRLRGFTVYPDGSRGGQPIEEMDLDEAMATKGVVYQENDSCKGGVCGI